jgi:polyphosphate glucokinase
MRALGVDVGGSGIKAAVVDAAEGRFVGERLRLDTPRPATPAAVVQVVREMASVMDHHGPVGIGVPAPVLGGVTTLAANIDPAWVGAPAQRMFADALGRPVALLNDADAAGVGEAAFGAARGVRGVVLMLTLGTGIGSALIHDGRVVPNTELGHIQVRGRDAEHRAAAAVRDARKLSWPEWAGHLSEVLQVYDALFWPDLIVLGGGVSRKAGKFMHLLDVRAPVRAATLENRAGIIGAATFAAQAE